MYRSVYVDFEGQIFHNLESLNESNLRSLEKFNARNLTRRKESRRQLLRLWSGTISAIACNRYQMRQAADRGQ